MVVRVRVFANLKSVFGTDMCTVELDEGATVGDLLGVLEEKYPDVKIWLPLLLVAVNYDYVEPGAVLSEQDEVALIPPVSGG